VCDYCTSSISIMWIAVAENKAAAEGLLEVGLFRMTDIHHWNAKCVVQLRDIYKNLVCESPVLEVLNSPLHDVHDLHTRSPLGLTVDVEALVFRRSGRIVELEALADQPGDVWGCILLAKPDVRAPSVITFNARMASNTLHESAVVVETISFSMGYNADVVKTSGVDNATYNIKGTGSTLCMKGVPCILLALPPEDKVPDSLIDHMFEVVTDVTTSTVECQRQLEATTIDGLTNEGSVSVKMSWEGCEDAAYDHVENHHGHVGAHPVGVTLDSITAANGGVGGAPSDNSEGRNIESQHECTYIGRVVVDSGAAAPTGAMAES
jgi:hypothetical protein